MKKNKKAFTNRLIIISEELGYCAASIAKILKLNRQTVDHWFQGRSMPRADRMKNLADLLGVSVSWLKHGIKVLDDIPINTLETLQKIAAMAPQNSSESPKTAQESTNSVPHVGEPSADFYKPTAELFLFVENEELAVKLAQAMDYIKHNDKDFFEGLLRTLFRHYEVLKFKEYAKEKINVSASTKGRPVDRPVQDRDKI